MKRSSFFCYTTISIFPQNQEKLLNFWLKQTSQKAVMYFETSEQQLFRINLGCYLPKQPSRGVLKKRCSENMQQINRRTPMPKCDFNKVALQLYWNHALASVFSCKFDAYFQNTFLKKTSGWLLLSITVMLATVLWSNFCLKT